MPDRPERVWSRFVQEPEPGPNGGHGYSYWDYEHRHGYAEYIRADRVEALEAVAHIANGLLDAMYEFEGQPKHYGEAVARLDDALREAGVRDV